MQKTFALKTTLIKYILSFTFIGLHFSTGYSQPSKLSSQSQIQLQNILLLQNTDYTSISSTTESNFLKTYQAFIQYLSKGKTQDLEKFDLNLDQFEDTRDDSDFSRLLNATLLIQKGLLEWSNGDEFWGSYSFYKAYQKFKNCDSTLTDYKKLNALFLILIDQLPNSIKNGANLAGLKGNSESGFLQLRNYCTNIQHLNGLNEEAQILYGYCLMNFKTQKQYIDAFLKETLTSNSPLVSFMRCSVLIKTQKGNEARKYLNKVSKKDFENLPFLHYLKGRTLLNSINPNASDELQSFLNNYEGNLFKTDAHLRLLWYYQINNNKFQAQKTYDLISKSNLVHTNEQSKEEATESLNKPIDITKARLLFDDGDYTKCIQLLHHISTDSLSAYYKPEYHYRLARAYEQNNQLNNAQIHFQKTIELSSDDLRYFGPYAALELAQLALKNNNLPKFKQLILKAKELNNGQYKWSIKKNIEKLEKDGISDD